MARQIPPATPELNRLRAAAALIPIIEAGLSRSTLSVQRALLMAAFCEWSTVQVPDDPEATKLAETVDCGLRRLHSLLATAV